MLIKSNPSAQIQLTVGELVRRNAATWPDHAAFVEEDRERTWQEIHDRSDALGRALVNCGVKPGDRVAMISSDCIEVAELFIACAKIGAVRVGINYRLAPQEIAQLLNDCDPTIVVVQGQHEQVTRQALDGSRFEPGLIGIGIDHGAALDYESLLAESISDIGLTQCPHDNIMICYTTGSTGVPKGIVYPHAEWVQSLVHTALAEGTVHDDVWLHAMPASGIPIMHMMRNLFHASKCVILGEWNPDKALMLIERERCSIMVLVPTMVTSLVNAESLKQYDVSSVRQLGYGAAPIPPAIIREAMKAFGCSFLQMYGTTELMGMAMMLYPSDHELALTGNKEILASAGKALPFVEVRIVDEDGADAELGEKGELLIKSDIFVPHLYNGSEPSRNLIVDGWLHTGDIAYRDKGGYIYLADRLSFRIKTGGFNVFPTEVENILAEHPAVIEVAVVGIPDPNWGERVHAVVTLRSESEATTEELRNFCRGKIADYKMPKDVEIWPELPKGVTGKIQKREIRDRCAS